MKAVSQTDMDISGIIICIVCVVILIAIELILLKIVIVALVGIFKNVYILKRRPKKEKVLQWIVSIGLRIFAMVVIVLVIIDRCRAVLDLRREFDTINEAKETEMTVSQEYLALLQNIPFKDEVINEAETAWENMLNEGLLYKEYFTRAEKGDDFSKIRSCYQGNSDNIVKWPTVAIESLVDQVEAVYDSELLPFTNDTLPIVDQKIKSYKEPLKVPAEVYKAEFRIRITMGKNGFSSETLYQIGRAADDVLKVLHDAEENSDGKIPGKKVTVKEWIFFGSMAVSFYLASIEYNDGFRDLPLIYYRIAEIFIYLDKYSPLRSDEAYSRHFRLMAEKALGEAGAAFDSTYDRGKIRKKIPYYYCYYADILDGFRKLCPEEEQNLAKECREYATRCVMGESEGKYCITCNNLQ